MVLRYITSTLQPNITLSLHENMHNCTIKLPSRLALPKITIIVDWQIFFQTPPQSAPPVHFLNFF